MSCCRRTRGSGRRKEPEEAPGAEVGRLRVWEHLFRILRQHVSSGVKNLHFLKLGFLLRQLTETFVTRPGQTWWAGHGAVGGASPQPG